MIARDVNFENYPLRYTYIFSDASIHFCIFSLCKSIYAILCKQHDVTLQERVSQYFVGEIFKYGIPLRERVGGKSRRGSRIALS